MKPLLDDYVQVITITIMVITGKHCISIFEASVSEIQSRNAKRPLKKNDMLRLSGVDMRQQIYELSRTISKISKTVVIESTAVKSCLF